MVSGTCICVFHRRAAARSKAKLCEMLSLRLTCQCDLLSLVSSHTRTWLLRRSLLPGSRYCSEIACAYFAASPASSSVLFAPCICRRPSLLLIRRLVDFARICCRLAAVGAMQNISTCHSPRSGGLVCFSCLEPQQLYFGRVYGRHGRHTCTPGIWCLVCACRYHMVWCLVCWVLCKKNTQS